MLQVYMLMVKWSDLTEKLIYRTYPEIHTFHVSSSVLQNISSADLIHNQPFTNQ